MVKRTVDRGAVGRVREPFAVVGLAVARGAAGQARGVVTAPVSDPAGPGRPADAADRGEGEAVKRLLWWMLIAGALALLAWSVLPVLAAPAKPVEGGESCEAREARLDRLTGEADRLVQRMMHVSRRGRLGPCERLASLAQLASLVRRIEAGMRRQAAECPVPDGYEADYRIVAAGAVEFAEGFAEVLLMCRGGMAGKRYPSDTALAWHVGGCA